LRKGKRNRNTFISNNSIIKMNIFSDKGEKKVIHTVTTHSKNISKRYSLFSHFSCRYIILK
ncbi:hypothetical protein LJB85_04035, partial [Porphyromonadaceae bacterium OttesenSCG-928-L07]|nr:hypothetical protein [Porphyromonadaceae bacterium OttesenSCG-928-L07]MDL2330948.1 hypothetical protein [Odoribacter sp. OttesenSCG-928-A06]